MHISLTPELESRVRAKVESGLYNNASEVVREALRFVDENAELVALLKLHYLQREVARGATQAERDEFSGHTANNLLEAKNSTNNVKT